MKGLSTPPNAAGQSRFYMKKNASLRFPFHAAVSLSSDYCCFIFRTTSLFVCSPLIQLSSPRFLFFLASEIVVSCQV